MPGLRSCLLTVGVLLALVPGTRAGSTDRTDLGDKVVAYCQKHMGEKVGEGECAHLAGAALKAAGAKVRGPDEPNKGDYTWGKLVLTVEHDKGDAKTTGKPQDLQPGDIIQFRDAKFAGKKAGKGHYTATMPHHTAIVAGVLDGGKSLKLYQQNTGGKRFVTEGELHLDDLTQGWFRIYRPVPEKGK